MGPDFTVALERVTKALADMGAGHPGPYAACWAPSETATLFGARGYIEEGYGPVTRTFEWVGSRFSAVELVSEHDIMDISGALAYTVGFEHGAVRIDGGEPRPMTIRVTHIYQRIASGWRIVDRHADYPPPDKRCSQPPPRRGGSDERRERTRTYPVRDGQLS
jgi:ketosteroid isomerase-like protein